MGNQYNVWGNGTPLKASPAIALYPSTHTRGVLSE